MNRNRKTVRSLKKAVAKTHGRALARQVAKTAKGYARARKLVRAETRENAGTGPKWERVFRLQKQAEAADEAYDRALKRAGEKRYGEHTDAQVKRAYARKVKTDRLLWKATGLARGEKRNPPSYRGKSVAQLEQMRVYAMARAYDNDWMVRADGRRDVELIDKALKAARKREAKQTAPNSGERFKKCVKTVSKRKGVTSPRGLCATIGRKKYGGQEFARMAIRGRKKNPPVATLHQGRTRADIFAVAGGEFKAVITGGKQFASEAFSSVKAALAWARVRMHELAWSSDKTAQNGKRNPEAAADKMFEVFHGFAPSRVIEYTEQEHHHEWLWAMGELISLEIVARDQKSALQIFAPDPSKAKFGDVVQCACNEEGNQIYFVGGDQGLDLKAVVQKLGLNQYDVRDKMELGRLQKIVYRTRKTFEQEGKVEIDFWHPLGEEHSEGVLPIVSYRPLNPSLELIGGRYFIAPGERELGGVSPGMVG